MKHDFHQIEWDSATAENWRELVRLAIREDLDRAYDWTTVLLVPDDAPGRADIVARQPGVIAGLAAAQLALAEIDRNAVWTGVVHDGAGVAAGQIVATLAGSARSLLTAERLLLNVLGRLSGIATLTRQFVDAIAGTSCRIYDTRKTIPGWRRLEKLAVRLGGGHNHRIGLYEAVLIKDNHLALGATAAARFAPAEAVRRVRHFLQGLPLDDPRAGMIVEVEVDTLEQLGEVLAERPDLVLLDNMPPERITEAVALRNSQNREIELEASGGVRLDTVAAIARTGVERISAGALTHGASWLDVGMDW